jgi:hypothetical protein
MAISITRIHNDPFDSTHPTLASITYQRAYQIGNSATLADADLEIGDTLPDDSSAEIVDARLDRERKLDPKTGKPGLGWVNVARVTAIKFNTGA